MASSSQHVPLTDRSSPDSAETSGDSQVNTDPDESKCIFESDGKLAFIHHKKVVKISNFLTSVRSMFEANSVAGYIFEIESNDKKWQCALTLGQLCDSRSLLGILQSHCQDALWYRVPRDAPHYADLGAYMFTQTDDYRNAGNVRLRNVATTYPAWQNCGTFVVSSELQINAKTRTCLDIDDRYVLYEKSWGKKKGKGASSDETVLYFDIKEPFNVNGFRALLLAMKDLLNNNYPAACLSLGGTVMSLGYQRIIKAGGSCPTILLTGDTETSKTTVLKACISITGNSDLKDFTAKKALQRSKLCDMPFAWDDPTSKDDVKFIVQALFNQAGKDTVQSSGHPRSPPIISANFACSSDKRTFSRQAIIKFERPDPQLSSEQMALKKAALDVAAKKASHSFLEALCLVENYLDESSLEDRRAISARMDGLFPGRIRSPEIYSNVMWFTTEVMKLSDMEGDVPLVWEYLERKVAPFISDLFSGVRDSSSLASAPEGIPLSVWDILNDFKHPLSKKQAATAFRLTNTGGRNCLAIAYDVAVAFLNRKIEGQFLLHELRNLPRATKGRLYFLSPDSDTDYIKLNSGKVVYGKGITRQCISIPLSDVPGNLLCAVQVQEKPTTTASAEVHDPARDESPDAAAASGENTDSAREESRDAAAASGENTDAAREESPEAAVASKENTDSARKEIVTIDDVNPNAVASGKSPGSSSITIIDVDDVNPNDVLMTAELTDTDLLAAADEDPYAGMDEEDIEKMELDIEFYKRSAALEAKEARGDVDHEPAKKKRKKGGKKKGQNLIDDIHPGILEGKRTRAVNKK